MRLDKRLTEAGLTRAQARAAIRDGRACVDGEAARDPGAQVDPRAVLTLDGVWVDTPRDLHLMQNKPAGVVTACEDARFETVFDLLPPVFLKKGLSAVGRLDRDVTGLLLFTTDGTLAHRLISPRWTVEKVYEAQVEGALDQACVLRMAEGLALSDFTAKPARLEILAPDLGLLTVTEGKFHQVKRMFQAIGHPVVRLSRRSVGGIALDPALAPGESRLLTEDEIARLYEITGGRIKAAPLERGES